MQKIIQGDCLDVMKSFPDNHFTCIITDSPYGISFMGKNWDKGIPSIEYWKEMLRITKPGGHLICAGLPRMFHRLGCVIEDSGWQIRDLLMHLFGSGFPKSHNNFGFEGYGTSLKPAWEGWYLAMKPLDGTFKQNAEKWGVAGINIEECRIGSTREVPASHSSNKLGIGITGLRKPNIEELNPNKGRWPANLILDEEAALLLDQQTEYKMHSAGKKRNKIVKSNYNASSYHTSENRQMNRFGDSGGASRFFYVAKASSAERNKGLEGLPLKETGIKNDSGRGFNETDPYAKRMAYNNHPTIKPIALMEYLIKLIMPPKDGLILDPFAGSGTTIIAAKRLGHSAIGIEKEPEYAEIATKRLEAYEPAPEQFEFDLNSNI